MRRERVLRHRPGRQEPGDGSLDGAHAVRDGDFGPKVQAGVGGEEGGEAGELAVVDVDGSIGDYVVDVEEVECGFRREGGSDGKEGREGEGNGEGEQGKEHASWC